MPERFNLNSFYLIFLRFSDKFNNYFTLHQIIRDLRLKSYNLIISVHFTRLVFYLLTDTGLLFYRWGELEFWADDSKFFIFLKKIIFAKKNLNFFSNFLSFNFCPCIFFSKDPSKLLSFNKKSDYNLNSLDDPNADHENLRISSKNPIWIMNWNKTVDWLLLLDFNNKFFIIRVLLFVHAYNWKSFALYNCQ
jgi:hypothetical protein